MVLKHRALRIAAAAALCLLLLAGMFYLYLIEPGINGPGFECSFHRITGLYCPSCGMSRGLHHLLRGNFARAFSFNQLSPLILAFLGFALFFLFRWLATGKQPPAIPLWLAIALVAVLVLYGVLRNLPWEPFNHLAPPG